MSINNTNKSFKEKVLKVVRSVPPGYVVSYGQVALEADAPRSARQVGWILNRNGDKGDVPWWRVINNSGRISIKGSDYNACMQKELLEKEGVKVSKLFEIDIEKYRYKWWT
jgi:methylated-DNA-protein-cysteine methyltransferase related protein